MPANKDAYTRYRYIDMRLQSSYKKKPTLDELKEYVSEKINKSISRSTLEKDIRNMRIDEGLGYFAPIAYDKKNKCYFYEDENYSINKLPVTENDLQGIAMAINILSRYKNLSEIKKMEELLISVGHSINIQRAQHESTANIDFQESNEFLGMQFISLILEAISHKKILILDYKKFQSDEVKQHKVHPYFLKEFENRIYLIGKDIHKSKGDMILTFALDRCNEVVMTYDTFKEEIPSRDLFFKNLLGIGNINQKPQEVLISCDLVQSQYFKTNPIHHSQTIYKEDNTEVIFSFHIILNYEFEMKLMAIANHIKILEPKELKNALIKKAKDFLDNNS